MDYKMELRSRFQDYFKTRNNELNSYLKREQKSTNIQTKENVRKTRRFDTLLERRNIECSPRKSALVNKPPPKMTRLEMLTKWKIEKEKKKVADNITKKPVFISVTKPNPGFGTVVPKKQPRNDFVRVTRSQKPIANKLSNIVNLAESDVFTSDNEHTKKTPENTTKYVSPFVTTSRGKGSVRKENLERSLRGLPSFTEYTTPDKILNAKLQSSAAAYFHTILDNEIVRLQAVCETWNHYKDAQEVPVDALDSIDVAIGQANLLINNKFKQFRGLIVACETEQTEEPVTCEDLQGFWDMVYMQVENLNARFKRLDTMRENNWEEILPQVNAKVAKKRVPPKRNNTAPTASSNIRAAIQAARKKVQQQSESVSSECTNSVTKAAESVFNGGFFVVLRSPTRKTPLKKTPVKKSTPNKNRRSLLVSVLSSEATKTLRSRNSSPGLNMITASQRSKSIENLTKEIVTNNFPILTPGKSILKDPSKKSTYIMNKSVLFKGNLESDDDDNTPVKTNMDTTFNLITFDSPIATETRRRRSSRRSVTMK